MANIRIIKDGLGNFYIQEYICSANSHGMWTRTEWVNIADRAFSSFEKAESAVKERALAAKIEVIKEYEL